jgi:hypothetical protein
MGRGTRIVLPGLIIAAMAMLTACVHVPAPETAATEPAQAKQQARVPNEYLVTLATDVNENVISEHYARFGIKYVHALEDETYLLILVDDPGPEEMEKLIQEDNRIKVVQPNIISWSYR